MKFQNLEKLLPFGYVYLVLLGIIKDGVFYYQLNMNILEYSSLTDVLISPLVTLTSHPMFLCLIIAYSVIIYFYYAIAKKKLDKAWARKLLNIPNPEEVSDEEIKVKAGTKYLNAIIAGTFCFFMGVGIGNGYAVATRMKEDKLKYNYYMTNSDNAKFPIYMIGSNSTYYFYLRNDNKYIQISTIQNTKVLEVLSKEERKELSHQLNQK